MFTGIIIGTGKVTKLDQKTKNRSAIQMTVDLGKYAGGLKIGQSVAINGVCLSATKILRNKCVFEMIDEILSLTINDKDGYLEIVGESKLPQLAAQLVKNAENILQNQIIAIKTKSSSELLAYLEEQYTIKNKLLREAQDNLANFKDRNLNIARSSFSNEQTRLETELQIITSVFQNIVTQLEQVKLQVAKDTPVFSFLKPVVVPTEKSAPKRSLIVIIWLFLGVVVSIGYLLAKEPLLDMIKQIKNNPS